jgi:hypothetical protein
MFPFPFSPSYLTRNTAPGALSYTSNHVSISNNAEAAQTFAEGDAARHAGVAPHSQLPTLSDTGKISQPGTLYVFPVGVLGHAQLLLTRFDAVAGPTPGKHRKRSMPGSRTLSFA